MLGEWNHVKCCKSQIFHSVFAQKKKRGRLKTFRRSFYLGGDLWVPALMLRFIDLFPLEKIGP